MKEGANFWHGFDFAPGPIDVEAAVFDDFRLTGHLPPDKAPAVIERDRLHMAARPGFNRKLLPLKIDPESGAAFSGGRYLLDTYENAKEFVRWVAEDFALDGTLLLERPDFADVTAQLWRVTGAHDFKSIHDSQRVYRTERWVADAQAQAALTGRWANLRDRAEERGFSSIWLLSGPEQGELALVTIADRAAGSPTDEPDFASIAALQNAPSLVDESSVPGTMRKSFDRTSWVFTIWFPYREGELNQAPLWPNSPPLPGGKPDINGSG